MSAPVPKSCRWHFPSGRVGFVHDNLYPGFVPFLLKWMGEHHAECVDADLHVRMSDGSLVIVRPRGRQ